MNQEIIRYRDALNQPDEWYGSDESLRLADNLLLFQLHNGVWDKNTDFGVVLTDEKKEQLIRGKSSNAGSLDNGTTVPEMRYLIKMYQATKIEKYYESLMQAVEGVLACQYPNGGFPQVVVRPPSYHGQITYNDNAMTNLLELWYDIITKPDEFFCINAEAAARIKASFESGLDCILKTQIYSVPMQMLTAWCAQHDRVTLQPAWGRDYESPSISGAESIGIINFLMRIENPNADIQNAIHSAVAFFAHVEIFGYSHETIDYNRVLVPKRGSRNLWARFICADTFEPLFFDRTSLITPTLRHRGIDKYQTLGEGRRNGYRYIGNWGQSLPDAYARWLQKNGLTAKNEPNRLRGIGLEVISTNLFTGEPPVISVGGLYRFGGIDWRVLAEEESMALLISDKIISLGKYHTSISPITWEDSYIRKYLNGEFYQNTFSDDEKRIIAETRKKNTPNPEHGTPGGNDTKDKIFLLSLDEVNRYFSSDDDRKVISSGRRGRATWYLRTPGSNEYYTLLVSAAGKPVFNALVGSENGIRPALWLVI